MTRGGGGDMAGEARAAGLDSPHRRPRREEGQVERLPEGPEHGACPRSSAARPEHEEDCPLRRASQGGSEAEGKA